VGDCLRAGPTRAVIASKFLPFPGRTSPRRLMSALDLAPSPLMSPMGPDSEVPTAQTLICFWLQLAAGSQRFRFSEGLGRD
jgi:hypothetical protein